MRWAAVVTFAALCAGDRRAHAESVAVTGPYHSLRAFCHAHVADSVRDGIDVAIGQCPAQRRALASPWRAAAITSFDAHLEEPQWYVAIETGGGWCVAEVPLCRGRGCTSFMTAIRRDAGAPAVVRFIGGWSEPRRRGDTVDSVEVDGVLRCTPGARNRPACVFTRHEVIAQAP
jgi:hypothetical protein